MSGTAPSGGASRDSGAGRKKRPQRVGSIVDAIFDELGIAEKVERARAAAEWEEIVGPHIARVTGKTRVKGRTLFVEVESAAWLTELNMARRRLLEKLNQDKEKGRIERIVFVQSAGRPSDPRHERDGRAGRWRARDGFTSRRDDS